MLHLATTTKQGDKMKSEIILSGVLVFLLGCAVISIVDPENPVIVVQQVTEVSASPGYDY